MTSAGTRSTGPGRGLLLGIDIGTSRLKLGAYDEALGLVWQTTCDTGATASTGSGQLNAGALWSLLQSQLDLVVRAVAPRQIRAIGVGGMAESGCLIGADSRPVSPMLLWHDRRGIRQAAALRRKAGSEFAALTGLKTTSVRSISKWMWMMDHGGSRQARWCGVPEWIALCLTGHWCTDPTLAVRTGAFDVLHDEYSPRLLKLAGAPAGIFPPVRRHPARAGRMLPELTRKFGLHHAPSVVIAGHDDVVAAYGADARPGDLVDSAGTAEGLIRIVSDPPLPSETVRKRMAMSRFYRRDTWALIAGAGSTGALMRLVADTLGIELGDLDKMVAPPGGYPANTIRVRLSKNSLPSVEINQGASPPEAWSAVLDLVCERLENAAERLKSIAGPASRLLLIGGAARSRELVERKSRRLGLPVVVLADWEATTRGAAALARLAPQN